MTEVNKQIAAAIKSWTTARHYADKILGYLNQGYSFMISRNDYDMWATKNPEYIHAYPAVFTGVMKFVLVDSVTDANTDIDYKYVATKNYTYGAVDPVRFDFSAPNGNITILEALERVFRWSMNKNSAVPRMCSSKDGIFQAFNIPFSDLQDLFAASATQNLYVVIGMQDSGIPELILWNETYNFVYSSMVDDVAMPVPPYPAGTAGYQLLVQS